MGMMKVVELRELSRREAPIHYIREYTAVAALESSGGISEADIAFTLERKPLGPPAISVRVLDAVDWPLLPVVRAIRDHVAELDHKGLLP
jgi:hypothetical protein